MDKKNDANSFFYNKLASFVIPPGFEPGTHSLEGCCSIQLSYGTMPSLSGRAQRYKINWEVPNSF